VRTRRRIDLLLLAMFGVVVAAHAAETTTYTYDALGRLSSAQVTGGARNGVQQAFQYDPAGNRTGLQTLGPANPNPTTLVPSSTTVASMGPGGGYLTLGTGGTAAGGTVSFSIDGVFLESVDLASGQARVRVHGYPPGTYTVTATYSGDATHDPKTTTFTITIKDMSWLPAMLELMLSD